jgi:hypothetical protein
VPTDTARQEMRRWLAHHGVYAQPDIIIDALIDLEIALHTERTPNEQV